MPRPGRRVLVVDRARHHRYVVVRRAGDEVLLDHIRRRLHIGIDEHDPLVAAVLYARVAAVRRALHLRREDHARIIDPFGHARWPVVNHRERVARTEAQPLQPPKQRYQLLAGAEERHHHVDCRSADILATS